MPLYQKVDDEWVLCQRPYVKWNGIWTACKNAYLKVAGVWVPAYQYDTVPPDPPLLALELYEDRNNQGEVKSRWIRVSVRQPQPAHDPSTTLIRVLTDYDGHAPTTQFGATYTSEPDSNWPGEPWSDWKYGPGFPHQDNSKDVTKQWPRNAQAGTILRGDTNYHFTAWAQDENGNWSQPVPSHYYIPKGGVTGPLYEVRETYFVPNHAGTWKSTGSGRGWTEQHPEIQNSPTKQGLWFFGSQFRDNGLNAKSTITSAQICFFRTAAGGNPESNVWLFWHGYHNPTSLPAPGGALNDINQIQKVGRIAKNQYKWFDIPLQHYSEIKNGNLKGFGLYHKAPSNPAVADDYAQMAHFSAAGWSGQVHVVWKQEV
jgi:hypothetical protein